MLETIKPAKAAEWYGYAYDVVLTEDRYLQAAEYANKCVRMFLKSKQYDNAVKWAENAFDSYLAAKEERSAGRLISTLVIILLAKEDVVAAQKAYMKNKGLEIFWLEKFKLILVSFFSRRYVEHDERYMLDNLFDGLDNFDNEKISAALRAPFVQNLDNETTKIIRDLLIKYEPKKGASAGGGGGGGDSGNQDEDDEAGVML